VAARIVGTPDHFFSAWAAWWPHTLQARCRLAENLGWVFAIFIAGGNALIWWGSERVYGTYSGRGQGF